MSWHDGRIDEIQDMWEDGFSATEIGKHYGVTKNSVMGLITRKGWTKNPGSRLEVVLTLHDRMNALHAKMDAFLATTVGRYRYSAPKKTASTGR